MIVVKRAPVFEDAPGQVVRGLSRSDGRRERCQVPRSDRIGLEAIPDQRGLASFAKRLRRSRCGHEIAQHRPRFTHEPRDLIETKRVAADGAGLRIGDGLGQRRDPERITCRILSLNQASASRSCA